MRRTKVWKTGGIAISKGLEGGVGNGQMTAEEKTHGDGKSQ